MTSTRWGAVALAAVIALTACQGGTPGNTGTQASSTQETTLTSSTTPDGASFTNPVSELDFPDPQVIADPDGGYFAIATNGNGMNVQALTSPDMVTWQQGTDPLPELAPWSSSGKVWAPEIIKWADGTYRLYYTTKGPNPAIQCLSVASAPTLKGPYTDVSKTPIVCEEAEGGSIDATAFITSAGKAYFYWKNDGNAIKVDTWIKVQELGKDGLSLVGEPKKIMKQDQPWEGNLIEGPAIVEVDGIFHMFYSGNDYGSDKYGQGHATATDPLGPWVKDPEPVMMSNDVAAGPGHSQLIKIKNQWWMAFHAWEPGSVGQPPGRQLWLTKVSFNAKGVVVDPPSKTVTPRP